MLYWLDTYDEQFRLRMARDPSSSWAVVDPELWLIYMQNSPSAYGHVFSTNQNRTDKCYKFNYSGNCMNDACAFSHSCFRWWSTSTHLVSTTTKNCQIGQVVCQDFVILKLDPDFRVRYQINQFSILLGKTHKSLLQVNLAIIIIKLTGLRVTRQILFRLSLNLYMKLIVLCRCLQRQ